MVSAALLVRLVAKPGKEAEATEFLKANRGVIAGETVTITWRGTSVDARIIYIFDAASETEQAPHAAGRVAAALYGQAGALFTVAPQAQAFDAAPFGG
jgi:hypothetical protein